MNGEKYSLISTGEGLVTEKKSRFLSIAIPIDSEEDAQRHIDARRKEHYDARHNCFAYVLGPDGYVRRCSDDGEPSQTAGVPILEAIDGASVGNAVVIVTRYFGGTLLGTGGLTRAYREAAALALSDAKKILRMKGRELAITLDYTSYGKLEYLLREKSIPVTDSVFGQNVVVKCMIPEDDVVPVTKAVSELSSGSAVCDTSDSVIYGLTDENKVILL